VVKAALASAALPSAPRDTAVWVDPKDSAQSLVLATHQGGLSVLGLDGKTLQTVPLEDAQGVDVQYGFKQGSATLDLVVAAEAGQGRLRVLSLDPKTHKLTDISGNTGVFSAKIKPSALALFKGKSGLYAFVSQSPAPLKDCLGQFQLVSRAEKVDVKFLRTLGELESAKPTVQPPSAPAQVPGPSSAAPAPQAPVSAPSVPKPAEVTALFVDSGKAKVYYTDPNYGVHEYSADPADKGQAKTASGFARVGLSGVLHGISVSKDHFVCLDQASGGSILRMFPRDARGEKTEQTRVRTEVDSAEAVEVVSRGLGKAFPGGLMVVADGASKTIQFYDWREVAKSAGLKG
jgi:myo-inositol-hexaphosphate 3-phosphohydrolase